MVASMTEPHRVGAALAAVLTLDDLVAVFRRSKATLFRMQAAGELEAFELFPRVGHQRRYSGRKIQEWLDGAAVATPARAFGAPRKR